MNNYVIYQIKLLLEIIDTRKKLNNTNKVIILQLKSTEGFAIEQFQSHLHQNQYHSIAKVSLVRIQRC